MLGPSRNMIPTAMAKIWLILIILLPLLGIFVNYLLRVGGTHTHTHIKFVLCTLLKWYVEAPCVGGCCADRILGYTLCFLRTCHECDINELLAYPTGAVTVHREQTSEREWKRGKVIEWVAQLKHKVVLENTHTHRACS